MLLVGKIFLRKKQNRDHSRGGTLPKIFSGERKTVDKRCREVIPKLPNSVATITKNRIVTRDIDLPAKFQKFSTPPQKRARNLKLYDRSSSVRGGPLFDG